jgi:methionyl-tRNA formyltransferase
MRMVMMATGGFAVPTFGWLWQSRHEVPYLITRPSRPTGRRRAGVANPMREAALEAGVTVSMPATVNAPEMIDQMRAWQPDLLVVCDYGEILQPDVLRAARLGGINLHASLLPRYRGAAPINWALYHGDERTGVTVIHMTPQLDAGPCLSRRSVAIDDAEDAVQLESRLAELGVGAVREALEQLEAWDGVSPLGAAQDPAQVTRAPRLQKSDGRVDWSRSARQIANQVRALKPWPGTYTGWQPADHPPLRLILDEVAVPGAATPDAPPGTVLEAPRGHLWVATASSVLEIRRIQPAGKRILSAEEFLRGYPLRPGAILQSPA